MHKCRLVAGLCPDPMGELTALPWTPWLHCIFKPKCTKCRLAAGLGPDPLGELTALPRPLPVSITVSANYCTFKSKLKTHLFTT